MAARFQECDRFLNVALLHALYNRGTQLVGAANIHRRVTSPPANSLMMLLTFAPQSKPDFSGLWQLSLEKSTFRGPAPKEILVKIDHREPTLVQSMHVIAADGGEQRLTFTYDTAGSESTITVTAGEGSCHAQWKGSELVIESELKTPSRTFHFRDHWSLSADGQTKRMAHLDDDLAGQVAVLEKAAPEVAARFSPE
jgi:hypothetical protein